MKISREALVFEKEVMFSDVEKAVATHAMLVRGAMMVGLKSLKLTKLIVVSLSQG